MQKTITEIIKYFFENKENCIVYICDSSDNRELARYRKFNSWFEKEKLNTKIEKLSNIIIIDEETSHYATMLFHKENSFYEILKLSYKEVIESLKK